VVSGLLGRRAPVPNSCHARRRSHAIPVVTIADPDVVNPTTLELGPRPTKFGPWIREIWAYRQVTGILARKDFQTKYKRASFGVVWAVVLPLLSGIVFVVLLTRIGRFSHLGYSYAAFVLSGNLAWAYFATVGQAASTSIVDGASMTDKVWFPRSILVLVPTISNLFGLGTSMLIMLAAMPIVGAPYSWRLVILIPAIVLIILFSVGFGLVTSALHVYYRDVKFIVQAGILLWFYVTPIIYPAHALGFLGPWLVLNPMTGVIGLFQFATAGHFGPMRNAVCISIAVTVVMFAVGLWAQRTHDRLFVDKL
jgi:lipopolysaccharide transport system permease protein